MMATPVAVALIWQLMYHPALGVLNYFLSLVNLPPSLWVASSRTVIPSVALVESFQATPFAALVILGGLAALPPELYEASKIDGANAIQRFRFLTFPLIWPYIVVVVLIRSIDALKAFDAIFVLTQGGRGARIRNDQHPAILTGVQLLSRRLQFVHGGHALRAGRGGSTYTDSNEKGSIMVRTYSVRKSQDERRQFTLLYGYAGKTAFWLVILALMLPSLFFFFWMISLSFKSQVENTAYPPVFLPSSLGLDSYAEVFRKHPFPQYAKNSSLAGFGATSLALLFGVPAAYGIVKWKRYEMALLILLARLVPPMSFLIPWFAATRSLGLSNSYIALILGHMVGGLPLVVWIMIGFFEDLNPELEDASFVDGCGPYGSFFRIALPLTLPGPRGVGDHGVYHLLERLYVFRRAVGAKNADAAGSSL